MTSGVSKQELEIMAHALGASTRGAAPGCYRNYYCAARGSRSESVLFSLAERGFVKRERRPLLDLTMTTFRVTPKGREVVLASDFCETQRCYISEYYGLQSEVWARTVARARWIVVSGLACNRKDIARVLRNLKVRWARSSGERRVWK